MGEGIPIVVAHSCCTDQGYVLVFRYKKKVVVANEDAEEGETPGPSLAEIVQGVLVALEGADIPCARREEAQARRLYEQCPSTKEEDKKYYDRRRAETRWLAGIARALRRYPEGVAEAQASYTVGEGTVVVLSDGEVVWARKGKEPSGVRKFMAREEVSKAVTERLDIHRKWLWELQLFYKPPMVRPAVTPNRIYTGTEKWVRGMLGLKPPVERGKGYEGGSA